MPRKEGPFMLAYYSYFELARQRNEELVRQAEKDHLADLARGPRRPLRSAFAGWLVAAAEWIDSRPQATINRASA
jgi:hypothetical protein